MASPRDRSYFDAYARGVNAFIEAPWKRLPIEFRILKYRPKPWQAEDSIVIANQMVKDLNFYTFHDAFAREKILAKLGPELTADLVREPVVARSSSDRDARRPQRSAGSRATPTTMMMTMTIRARTMRSRSESADSKSGRSTLRKR
jgi:acyl-homoserine lactone acylase PvdQ